MSAAETTEKASIRRTVGRVVSNKMQKSVTVSIERLVKHPQYKRYIRRRKKYMIHDDENQCRIGDTVRFMETRPLSKSKRWRLVEVVERAK